MIPFASFEPDRSDFDTNTTDTVLNVMPRLNGWGPFPSLSLASNALPAVPKGAFLARTSSGTYRTFAGTATKLYEFNGTTRNWDDVSKPATTYAVPSEGSWQFAQFGDLVIATNGVDTPQKFNFGGGSTFDDLGGSPPKGSYITVVGDFLLLGSTDTSVRQVWWSGLNNAEFWTPRKQSSDFQTFPEGGQVLGMAGFDLGCVIFQDNIIREMTRDPNFVFSFQRTDNTRTIAAPLSIVSAGGSIFFATLEGFFRYGRPSTPIGNERVDRFFADDVDSSYLFLMQGASDPINKTVYWRYRSNNHTNADTTDRVILYNYALDRWSLIDVELSYIFPSTTPGQTLESLDALGYTLDTLPTSLDSRQWAGGTPLIGGFDADFKLGFFSGSPLDATLQTGDQQLAPPFRSYVSGFRLVGDPETYSGRVSAKSTYGAARTWGNSASSNRTGLVPARSSARLHRFEVTIPSQTWAHAHGVEPEAVPEGEQ